MSDLTPKSTPPPIPPVTPGEEEAQSFLRRVRELLWFMEYFLETASERIPYPQDAVAEDMGSGIIPQSLAYALKGSIECAMADHLQPLHNLLRDAVAETPEKLVRDWQKRQRKGKR